ncbi:hypothetical protein PAP_08580 [Palaeococcus pacificus DY20341]|uniref:Citrate transporter-like domain-containing protein n=1 Tax=Palaeococcus pacificus DY20341 TaxID=1343739 RepID=A0A075LVT7_9EURY|nr:SLC13 family permease [Palaeococcus pacificus]AIF70097.1 hypothetical protein PAP_08580 [Palaeococcus pacificus DY20341]
MRSEKTLTRMLIEEWLFSLSLIALFITSLYAKRIPSYPLNDFKVVFTLFVFLVIIKGLEKSGFLKALASRFEGNHIGTRLILLTAVLSMFITNDVALLTVVPLTLALEIENVEMLIILETIAANGASALTPFGNPQNIFIYYHYHVHPAEFVKTIAPFTFMSIAFVLLLSWKNTNIQHFNANVAKLQEKAYLYLTFFLLFIMAVLRIVPLLIGIIPIVYAFIKDREALKVDYFLLGTFLAFFGFTDNMMHIISLSLDSPQKVFLTSALLSQVISNVPSTLLLADFTENWRALLWGVSVGGYGTLIGSLASLISYRLYKAKYGNSKEYLVRFHIYNVLAFIVGIITWFLFGNCLACK